MNETTLRRNESAAMRVLEAVAEATGDEITSLNPPLGSVVDPDSLEALLAADPDSDVTISFRYAGCRVTVTGDGVDVVTSGEDGR